MDYTENIDMNIKETAQTGVATFLIGGPLIVLGIIGFCKALIWGLPRLTTFLERVTGG